MIAFSVTKTAPATRANKNESSDPMLIDTLVGVPEFSRHPHLSARLECCWKMTDSQIEKDFPGRVGLVQCIEMNASDAVV